MTWGASDYFCFELNIFVSSMFYCFFQKNIAIRKDLFVDRFCSRSPPLITCGITLRHVTSPCVNPAKIKALSNASNDFFEPSMGTRILCNLSMIKAKMLIILILIQTINLDSVRTYNKHPIMKEDK